ncbi:hypothetical protein ACFFUB_07350 [Algimonas porphyrae]|uniref:Uncharacterized protein n=1 Tax=Algimonas porphyrae TaxID=1128113 RepID=A0ABQ5V0N9_9PROT|nr:hypothetical protein [Algimonas porphyrae]GLQ21016.1 hypothetical protein GCM10007854_19710 [Algimonas porphyrae]
MVFGDLKNTPFITKNILDELINGYPDYTAIELLEQFLVSLCTKENVGSEWTVDKAELAYLAKARTYSAALWSQNQAYESGWLSNWHNLTTQDGAAFQFSVSARGWQRFYELQRNKADSRQAFMALQFNNESLREIILPVIKSACIEAGYDLLTVDENRKAGSIDDKIRVDIRNSRFLVVDLSDQNAGAYFEAGFAEGLGKPVFYICDKDVFDAHHKRDGGKKSIHFDIEHHDIISWDRDDPMQCAEELKASIRNTLPDEAIMV